MSTFKTLAFLLCLGLASFAFAGERLVLSNNGAAEEEQVLLDESQRSGGIISPQGPGGMMILPGCFPLIVGEADPVRGVQFCPSPREPERVQP